MSQSPSTILIGFADALSAPEVAFNLMEAGFRVVAFMRKNKRIPALSRCKSVDLLEITSPEDNVTQSVADLSRLCKSSGASAVMPLNDKALWLCDRIPLDGSFRIAGATGKTAEFALDKTIQISAADQAGFNTPRTITIHSRSEASQIDFFPVILKSALAVTEEGGRLLKKENIIFCADKAELDCGIASWSGRQPLIAQSIHHGTGEGLFGFASPKGFHCWSAHRRVRMMNPKGSGSSACRALHITDQPIRQTEKMLTGIGWQGPFMVELLRDDNGKLWFVELNGRPWGSMALALRMGYQYPSWAVKQIFDPDFIPANPPPHDPVTCRHLGRELIHILQVIRGPSSAAIPNWPSVWQTLTQVLKISKDDRWYNWRAYNKSLFVADTYNTLMDETVRKWLMK
jgi:predicted ATP-grasp superfamily ATP-dependent carboligase